MVTELARQIRADKALTLKLRECNKVELRLKKYSLLASLISFVSSTNIQHAYQMVFLYEKDNLREELLIVEFQSECKIEVEAIDLPEIYNA